jgi:hypothetical protein
MIELDEALKITRKFIEEVSRVDGGWELEEATLDNKKNIWHITYSFLRGNEILPSPIEPLSSKLSEILSNRRRRLYRTVKINSETGQVLEMKAGFAERQPEAA